MASSPMTVLKALPSLTVTVTGRMYSFVNSSSKSSEKLWSESINEPYRGDAGDVDDDVTDNELNNNADADAADVDNDAIHLLWYDWAFTGGERRPSVENSSFLARLPILVDTKMMMMMLIMMKLIITRVFAA